MHNHGAAVEAWNDILRRGEVHADLMVLWDDFIIMQDELEGKSEKLLIGVVADVVKELAEGYVAGERELNLNTLIERHKEKTRKEDEG